MLKDIQFCSCSQLTGEELNTKQCMIFSFTPRALKILRPQFIEKIAADDVPVKETEKEKPDINGLKESSDIPIQHEDNEPASSFGFKIHKIDKKKWRIPVCDLDRFLVSLFRFLPGYFQPMEQQHLLMENGIQPVCCLAPVVNQSLSPSKQKP